MQSNNPKISIIIPIYNAEKTIIPCINSILNQSYKNYELILVDNNSTDNTKKIIKNFQKKSKKIKYLFEKQKGRGPARNTGEKSAKEEIILMTDSDCILPKNWINNIIKPLQNENFDAVQGFQKNISNDFWSIQHQIQSEKKYTNIITLEKENIPGMIDTKNFAIKKNTLKKIGYSSRKYISGNDTDLSLKLAKHNCKVKFLKNLKVKHFHSSKLKKIINKQIYRGMWTYIITKDHKNNPYIKNFKKKSAQKDNLKLFKPYKIKKILQKNPSELIYETITGIFWRIGLIKGYFKYKTLTSPSNTP